MCQFRGVCTLKIGEFRGDHKRGQVPFLQPLFCRASRALCLGMHKEIIARFVQAPLVGALNPIRHLKCVRASRRGGTPVRMQKMRIRKIPNTYSGLGRYISWFKRMNANEYIRRVKTKEFPRLEKSIWHRNYFEVPYPSSFSRSHF